MFTPQPKTNPPKPVEEPTNKADNKEKSPIPREGGMSKEGEYPNGHSGGMAGEL